MPLWRSIPWLPRSLSWSNNREAWLERLGFLFLFLGMAGLFSLGHRLPSGLRFLLWGLWLIALAVVLRQGWIKLLGPVFFYDLARTGRRSHYFLLRFVYGCFIFVFLWGIYLYWLTTWEAEKRGKIPAVNELANFNASFFFAFMWVQMGLAALFTPAYTAGAIGEEKERRTIEYLLATDLRSYEIVFSKLASRLTILLLLLLTGLPILSMLQILGGAGPDMVLGGYALTFVTVLSLAALSILNSVLLSRGRDAIIATYVESFAYLVVSFLLDFFIPPVWAGTIDLSFGAGWFTLADLMDWLTAGNPFYQAYYLGSKQLDIVLRSYVLFHLVVTAICIGWAILRLRAKALPLQTVDRALRLRLWLLPFRRPIFYWLGSRLSWRSLIWKETLVDNGLRWNWLARFTLVSLLCFVFLPPLCRFLDWPFPFIVMFLDEPNTWVTVAGTTLAIFSFLAVAIRAAGTISGERERRTLDNLLACPLEAEAILSAKWWGSILGPHKVLLFLALVWGVGLFQGGLHFTAPLLLMMAWIVFASFSANVGLWFSTVSASTFRATILTILGLLAAWFGHWIIWGCYGALFVDPSSVGTKDTLLLWSLKLHTYGLTTPVNLSVLAFSEDYVTEYFTEALTGIWKREGLERLIAALAGLVLYAVASRIIWKLTLARFQVVTCRVIKKPEAIAARRPWLGVLSGKVRRFLPVGVSNLAGLDPKMLKGEAKRGDN